MNLREMLNGNPAVAKGVVAGVVVVAVIAIGWQYFSSGSDQERPSKAYFTVDDGQSYFEDDVTRVAPFLHDGREAVQCYVFGNGKQTFVGYLLKYSPQVRSELEKVHAVHAAIPPLPPSGVLVKKPGDRQWISQADPASASITQLTAPDGMTADVQMLIP